MRISTLSQTKSYHVRITAAGGIGLIIALWPRSASAECSPLDAGGCVDAAMYSFWEGIAGFGWWLDRTLLMAAFQVDQLRWWLIEVAFTSAFQALSSAVTPFLAPIATLAVIVGCLLFLLLPVTGRMRIIDIRHVLLWTLLGPALLTISGPAIVELERARTGMGSALFTAVNAVAPGAIFGSSGSDMASPTPLYPSNPCGVTLARHTGEGLRLDDLAAALVWADAGDIHCPEARGPGRDLPDAFYDAAPSGAGYATDQDVATLPPGNDRAEAVRNMQRGAIRTFVGVLPSMLSVLEALLQLLFALSLVALWVSLPIGLLFVFFQPSAGTVTGLARRLLAVLQVSWTTSVLLGLVSACLVAAAELRNAAAYTGFALGGGALVVYLLRVAIDTFTGCLRTLSDTAAVITGLAPYDAAQVTAAGLATVAGAGVAAATGGVAAGVVAAGAFQQTGSLAYAGSAALGRIQPVAQAGELALTLGLLDNESTLAAGLEAGRRSSHSLRSARLQIRADAARPDTSGMTLRQRTLEGDVATDLESRSTISYQSRTLLVEGNRLRIRDAGAPQDALQVEVNHANVPRLLALGYHVQPEVGGVRIWRTNAAPKAGENERARLERLGAIRPAVVEPEETEKVDA